MAQDPPGTGTPLVDAECVHEVVHEVLKPVAAQILASLCAKPMTVRELTERVPVERCTVSNTL